MAAPVGTALIAVGTTRAPKIRAVELALGALRERFPDFLPGEIRLESRGVSSGVPATPRSTEETMRGARQRASSLYEILRSEGKAPVFAIGLEGGVSRIESAPLLESWAYVTDGRRGYFGGSGSVPLPEGLSESVFVQGLDLGSAADRYFGRLEVAANEGTFGILTRMMVSREQAFTRALIHALAPFYNGPGYGFADKG
ncbi:MAG TPA: inosine/xanthosine triphosphatase [Vicinamibacteria bacterium]